MIKRLSSFLNRYSDSIFFLTGLFLCLITFAWQLKGITSYQYYDLHKYRKVIENPLYLNYYMGGLFMLFSLRKSFWWTLKGWVQGKRWSKLK